MRAPGGTSAATARGAGAGGPAQRCFAQRPRREHARHAAAPVAAPPLPLSGGSSPKSTASACGACWCGAPKLQRAKPLAVRSAPSARHTAFAAAAACGDAGAAEHVAPARAAPAGAAPVSAPCCRGPRCSGWKAPRRRPVTSCQPPSLLIARRGAGLHCDRRQRKRGVARGRGARVAVLAPRPDPGPLAPWRNGRLVAARAESCAARSNRSARHLCAAAAAACHRRTERRWG